MGKTRDLFKKIRDTKGNFHAKIGTVKDRKGMELTKGGKNTQKNYSKNRTYLDNHDGVNTHLELGILECEVKWAFWKEKAYRKHHYEQS